VGCYSVVYPMHLNRFACAPGIAALLAEEEGAKGPAGGVCEVVAAGRYESWMDNVTIKRGCKVGESSV
jgi:hypothetical protein